MKWQSESWSTYCHRLAQWRRWFAWHPVRIGDEIVWLETVERKGELRCDSLSVYWSWEYREPA